MHCPFSVHNYKRGLTVILMYFVANKKFNLLWPEKICSKTLYNLPSYIKWKDTKSKPTTKHTYRKTIHIPSTSPFDRGIICSTTGCPSGCGTANTVSAELGFKQCFWHLHDQDKKKKTNINNKQKRLKIDKGFISNLFLCKNAVIPL